MGILKQGTSCLLLLNEARSATQVRIIKSACLLSFDDGPCEMFATHMCAPTAFWWRPSSLTIDNSRPNARQRRCPNSSPTAGTQPANGSKLSAQLAQLSQPAERSTPIMAPAAGAPYAGLQSRHRTSWCRWWGEVWDDGFPSHRTTPLEQNTG
mmetsp:Transcript_42711/g.91609  ORF Transcript_42711/g.91609 Transcript_42711/m.91609 type:complete len:153 (-) Transcript_42711:57-515(-)